MKTETLFSSATDNWSTPQEFYDALNREFNFTLDPCADNSNHKCEKYFTKQQNGLIQDWGKETVFCNPPYGRDIGKWIQKAVDSAKAGAVVVMLIPARTDTKWFHELVFPYAEILFVKGRLKFGGSANAEPFPSMVAVFTPYSVFGCSAVKVRTMTTEGFDVEESGV